VYYKSIEKFNIDNDNKLEIKEEKIRNILNNNYIKSNPWIMIDSMEENATLYPHSSIKNLTENNDIYQNYVLRNTNLENVGPKPTKISIEEQEKIKQEYVPKITNLGLERDNVITGYYSDLIEKK
tara:strand:- start:2830 stop:3204 length:375 start_codon:yes stop_codon:yes gene_type:complete